MLVHDDILTWQGFGGLLDLASGQCRLRIFDLSKAKDSTVTHLKPMVVVVSDLPGDGPQFKKMSVRACASHIASTVAQRFKINPQRMVFVEYAPSSSYGEHDQHRVSAKFDIVDFTWHSDKALHPKWRPLESPLVDIVAEQVKRLE